MRIKNLKQYDEDLLLIFDTLFLYAHLLFFFVKKSYIPVLSFTRESWSNIHISLFSFKGDFLVLRHLHKVHKYCKKTPTCVFWCVCDVSYHIL